ncbi:hypothetical protein ABTD90_19925, partial [Acinetobacter baumannii]
GENNNDTSIRIYLPIPYRNFPKIYQRRIYEAISYQSHSYCTTLDNRISRVVSLFTITGKKIA